MDSKPTPFDSEAPLGSRRAVIRRNPEDINEIEMIEALWGSDPRFSDGISYRFARAEGQRFAHNRCLVPASEFQMSVGDKRYRVTLDSGNFFYLAAIWEPPYEGDLSTYRIITVAANADVAPYQDRHGAIIQRRQVMQWLDHRVPESELLATPPARLFCVQEIVTTPRQSAFML